MKTFEEALDDIYARAKKRQIKKRLSGGNKRLITLITLSVVIVLSVVFVWKPWSNDSQNDTVVLEDKNGDKNWISDIPGTNHGEDQYVIVTTSGDENNNDVEPTKPKFYYITPLGGALNDVLATDTDFAKVDNNMFKGRKSVVVDEKKVNTTKNVLDFGVFNYKESEVLTSTITQKPAAVYGMYDSYVSADGSKNISFLEGTDIITYYFDDNTVNTGEKINEQRAKEIADDFIAKILPGYSLDGMYTTVSHEPLLHTYYVAYSKVINGLITDEDILVGVTEYGQVNGYNGENVKKYDNINVNVSDETINNSINLIKEALSGKIQNFTVLEDMYLVSDSDGNVYISISIKVNHEQLQNDLKFYIPI